MCGTLPRPMINRWHCQYQHFSKFKRIKLHKQIMKQICYASIAIEINQDLRDELTFYQTSVSHASTILPARPKSRHSPTLTYYYLHRAEEPASAAQLGSGRPEPGPARRPDGTPSLVLPASPVRTHRPLGRRCPTDGRRARPASAARPPAQRIDPTRPPPPPGQRPILTLLGNQPRPRR